MTNRERENRTLNFQKPQGRGAVEETFYPWTLTIDRFIEDGMPREIAKGAVDITNNISGNEENQKEKYLTADWGQGVMAYEKYLGFDPVRRIHFVLPFRRFEEKVISEDEQFVVKQDLYGRIVRQNKESGLEMEERPVVTSQEDWERLMEHAKKELELYFTDEAIAEKYGPLKEAHERGDYSIRLNIEGFFWVPRELLGIEAHLYAFYDEPKLLHEICSFMLEIYQNQLIKVVELVKPDVIYIMEDLSGKNGPMISGET